MLYCSIFTIVEEMSNFKALFKYHPPTMNNALQNYFKNIISTTIILILLMVYTVCGTNNSTILGKLIKTKWSRIWNFYHLRRHTGCGRKIANILNTNNWDSLYEKWKRNTFLWRAYKATFHIETICDFIYKKEIILLWKLYCPNWMLLALWQKIAAV